MENQLAKTSTELTATAFEDFKSLDDMMAFGEQIAKSSLSPLKVKEDVVAALLMGRELGLGVMVSINNIYPINGKASSGIHIIAGQLLKVGVTYEVLNDYEPVFQIVIKGSQAKNKDGELVDTFVPVRKVPYSESIPSKLNDLELRGKTPIDTLTRIKFKRQLKQPDGSYRDMEIISSFYYSEIPKDYLEGSKAKDNWTKWLSVMMYTRCFTNGAKRIADDVILGLYETSELADANNIPVKIEDGIATIVQTTIVKEKEKSPIEEAKIDDSVNKA